MRESETDLYGQQQMGENAGWDSLKNEEPLDTRKEKQEFSDEEVRQLWEQKALEIAENAVRNEGESIEDFRKRVNDIIPTIEEFRERGIYGMQMPQATQGTSETKPAQEAQPAPQPTDQPTAEAQPAAGNSQENKENSDTTLHSKLVAALNRQEFADYLGDIDLNSLNEKDADGNYTHSNEDLILAVRKVRTAYQQALQAKFAARKKDDAAKPATAKPSEAKPAEAKPAAEATSAENAESKSDDEKKHDAVASVLKKKPFADYVEGVDVSKVDDKDENGNYIYSIEQLTEAKTKAVKSWQEAMMSQFRENHKGEGAEAKTPEEAAIAAGRAEMKAEAEAEAEAKAKAEAEAAENAEEQKSKEAVERDHNERSRVLRSKELRPFVEGIDFNMIDKKNDDGSYYYPNEQLAQALADAMKRFQQDTVTRNLAKFEAQRAEAAKAAASETEPKAEEETIEDAENDESGEIAPETAEKIGEKATEVAEHTKEQQTQDIGAIVEGATKITDLDRLSYTASKANLEKFTKQVNDLKAELAKTSIFQLSKRKELKGKIDAGEKAIETTQKMVSDYEARLRQQQQAA